MKIEEVMSLSVQTIGAYTSIQDAARLMAANNIGALPVVDTSGHLIGIVTDRDITIRSLANGLWPHSTIDRVMTMHPQTIAPTADLEEALEEMLRWQIGRLVVCGPSGQVMAVVSLGDILSKGNVEHLIPRVSRALGHRSTAIPRIPDQFAHVG